MRLDSSCSANEVDNRDDARHGNCDASGTSASFSELYQVGRLSRMQGLKFRPSVGLLELFRILPLFFVTTSWLKRSFDWNVIC